MEIEYCEVSCRYCSAPVRLTSLDAVNAHEAGCRENPTNKVVFRQLELHLESKQLELPL